MPIDFQNSTYEELDQHAMEQLVFDNGAVSTILRGHLFVEGVIEELLRRSLPKPDALLKKSYLTFDGKIDLARALDVISEQHVSLFRAINKIRNQYAHNASYQITLAELNSLKFQWEEIQHKAFEAASTKGPDEAARIAVIFLCWRALALIKEPSEANS